jgi:ribosomal protein S18 acetylase RimI-like enzyme
MNASVSGQAGNDPVPTSVEVASAVRVVDFESRWRDDFARLNIDWLERWFTVEPVDREVLGDPETHVLAGGGRVLFAVDASDHALGTVALMRHEHGVVELTKMAVEPKLRGIGVGRKLMIGALDAFARMGGHELFLETNKRLAPAIRLYESVGFRHQPTLRPGSHYQRANVYMVWEPDELPGSRVEPSHPDS